MVNRNESMKIWASFLQSHAALVDVLESELQAQRELPLSWYDVLMTLAQAPRAEMRMQDLARGVLLSKSGLTRLFDRMEQAGLVERKSCPSDKRGTLAAMTPEGRRVLRRAMPIHGRGVAEHFLAHLTDDETVAMQSAFDKILAALGHSTPDCDAATEAVEGATAIR